MQAEPDTPADIRAPDSAQIVVLACLGAAALTLVVGGITTALSTSREAQYGPAVVGFGLILPVALGIVFWPRLHAATPEAMRPRAIALAAVLVALFCGARLLSEFDGAPGIAAFLIIGGLGLAAATLLSFLRPAPKTPPRWHGVVNRLASPDRLPLICLCVFILVVLVFAPAEIGPKKIALSLVLAFGALIVAGSLHRPWSPSRWWVLADVAVLGLVALLTIDISGYWGTDIQLPGTEAGQYTPISASAQLHQHFFLGAVNDIFHGRTLLVDTNAVYGIGNTYVIAAWFTVFPLLYGPFTLFGGVMALAVLVLGWAIARAAGVGRVAVAIVLGLAVMLMVLSPPYAPTLYNNLGGIRFIPPYALIAVALLIRRPNLTSSPWIALTVGFFATWSFESITPCLTVFGALMIVEAARAPTLRAAVSGALRSVGVLVGGLVGVHVLFGLVTLMASGSWPDWFMYIDLFRAWSVIVSRGFGLQLETWSRIWPVGFLYGATIVGSAALARAGRPEVSWRTIVVLAGMAGAGIGFIPYFISHAQDFYLIYVALPGLVIVAIWLTLAPRSLTAENWRGAAAAAGAMLATVLAAGSWSASEARFPATVAAHLIPGGASLEEDWVKLWDSPVVNPDSPEVEALMNEYFPDDEALTLIDPDLGEEALLRTGRANLLPTAYLWQDEVALDVSYPPVERAIDALKPGTHALLQDPPEPGDPPIVSQAFGNVPLDSYYGPLAQAAFDHLTERFRIKRIAEGPNGIYVGELQPRGASEAGGLTAP